MLGGNHWRGWRRDLRGRVAFALADALRWLGWRCDDLGMGRASDAVWRVYLWTIEGERWT